MNKVILITGATCALIAVLLGAFAAHGLEKVVEPESVNSFKTGVQYQMYHAIACLFLGMSTVLNQKALKRTFYLFLGGITLFSGSIYLLVLDELIGVNLSSIGFITPLGGLLLIFGWVSLIFSLIKIK